MATRKTSEKPEETDLEVTEELEQPKVKEVLHVKEPDYFSILGIPYPDEFQPFQDNYCPNCQDKLRTDLNGDPMCPAMLKKCPRNN